MIIRLLVTLLVTWGGVGSIGSVSYALPPVDRGCRYTGDLSTNTCARAGDTCRNPRFIGECGDLQGCLIRPAGASASEGACSISWEDFRSVASDLSTPRVPLSSLQGANLAGVAGLTRREFVLSGSPNRGFNFTGTRWRGTHVEGSSFRNANFTAANLQELEAGFPNNGYPLDPPTDFSGAIFHRADARGGRFYHSRFEGSNMSRMRVSTATVFTGATFTRETRLPDEFGRTFIDQLWEANRRGMILVDSATGIPEDLVRYVSSLVASCGSCAFASGAERSSVRLLELESGIVVVVDRAGATLGLPAATPAGEH